MAKAMEFEDEEENYCVICQKFGHCTIYCPRQTCKRCNQYGHSKLSCPGRSPEPTQNKSQEDDQPVLASNSLSQNTKTLHCAICQMYTHTAEQCPTMKCNLCDSFGHILLNCPLARPGSSNLPLPDEPGSPADTIILDEVVHIHSPSYSTVSSNAAVDKPDLPSPKSKSSKKSHRKSSKKKSRDRHGKICKDGNSLKEKIPSDLSDLTLSSSDEQNYRSRMEMPLDFKRSPKSYKSSRKNRSPRDRSPRRYRSPNDRSSKDRSTRNRDPRLSLIHI